MRAGTPILERGDLKTVFEHSFQCFSYKSFVKLSRKGGGRGGGLQPFCPSPKFMHGYVQQGEVWNTHLKNLRHEMSL